MDGAHVVGTTPVGRATVNVFVMNADDFLLIRVEVIAEGEL